MSETTAKAIRVITLPPIIALFLIILLKGYFPDGHDLMAIVLLCGLPLLSYLYWKQYRVNMNKGEHRRESWQLFSL